MLSTYDIIVRIMVVIFLLLLIVFVIKPPKG